MSSLTRMLSVLDLFTKENTALTADQIADQLHLARTTCYRYIAELMHAGLLVSNAGTYGLGPRIIQFDYRIRESDPLINSADEVLSEVAQMTYSMGLLASMYNDQIINIHQTAPVARTDLLYGRGQAVPTFRSCSSKVILAHLRGSRLKRIWNSHQQEPDVQALGGDWPAFAALMEAIRRNGYWVSRQEVETGAVGIAAPVFFPTGEIAGSMTLIFHPDHYERFKEEELGRLLLQSAQQVTARLAQRLTPP
ncbi:helix-turn-helix domain-containing protein [Ideonella sp. B7]|uniref:IclR family transcriptional regulator n=1 Tax=Ideonella benzenivorans TaxID=2831643 RepID=UPI001CED8502|nr:IclR family transcriptional regulator C-terminal domain-containing protein [Ideonella benzenivorans]MCA6215560.1 helix-turn-helix domain-containing protein [Ideonella benzenivorans]